MNDGIDRVPFSYFGSWMSLSIPAGETRLYLRNHHMRANNLFTLELVDAGQRLTPRVKRTPTCLDCTAASGHMQICFDGPDSVRLRGKGDGILFTGERIHAYQNGANLAVFNLRKAFRRYQFEVLQGQLQLSGAYVSQEEGLENPAIHPGGGVESVLAGLVQPALLVKPGADGYWELAIDEFWSTWQRPQRSSFDDCLQAASTAFDHFRKRLGPVPAQWQTAGELAAYIDWSCVVAPTGLIQRPTMFMSKNWMNNVWSWDQCFNAMALAHGHPDLALDQMLTLVDHQDAFGAYTDAFNDMEMHYNFSKPPVHGFTLQELLRLLPAPPAPAVLETLYVSLGRQADWWMTYRVLDNEAGPAAALNGMPYYLHGNDSGWDNSTMFSEGVPLVAPDLAALLTLQMDALAALADRLGKQAEGRVWQQRAEALFAKMMDQLWVEDRFVARLGRSGAAVTCLSLIPWLPLILGERLPRQVRESLKQGIEGHLTQWGLATERVDSPKYVPDGYWQGPIWAPSTFLAVVGLERAGFPELADEVAMRFCKLCAQSGFAENFDALTGAPLRDPAYTWTASVFLLLAQRTLGK